MLEVKNLVKVYKTKGGVETRALDGVTVNFPETGLVFLLGKSGSGKSTLLNMVGGLDRPDSGEIIVKGRSSKDFSQADFDSYRNTFIGFIFQEYNVLNEFNIEQNIALALQLQGKKNDKEAVNKLLKEVDLEGFNRRKPNTLSGGQKQRIAIARALIKQPEIIMADEPTGALDSNTGKQVLETLKKLSKTKLVIIVSHDQDFAEEYGDRIIELKDGKIISDKSKEAVPPQVLNEKMQIINGNIIDIKKGSALTEADFKQLYQLIKKQDKEVLISTGEENIKTTKKAARISEDGKGERFANTKEVKLKEYDGKQTKFIRSHMPFSRSFKMGASGLKTKPIRLIFTILLATVSFTMFGVASALMLYNESYSISTALEKEVRRSEAVKKYYKYNYTYATIDNKTGQVAEVGNSREDKSTTYFGAQEVADLNSANNNKFVGVFNFETWDRDDPNFEFSTITIPTNVESKDYYSNYCGFYGFTDAGADYFTANGFQLTGTHPVKATDLAISNYTYDLLKASGMSIPTQTDVVGKKLQIGYYDDKGMHTTIEFTITGVYDFGPLDNKFDALKQAQGTQTDNDRKLLGQSFNNYLKDSFYSIGYVAPAFYEQYGYVPTKYEESIRSYNFKGYGQFSTLEEAESRDVTTENMMNAYIADTYGNNVKYYDTSLNETSKITLQDNEVLLPYSNYHNSYLRDKYYESLNGFYNSLSHYSEPEFNEIKDQISHWYESEPTNEIVQAFLRLRNGFGEKWGEEIGYPEADADFATVKTYLEGIYPKGLRQEYLSSIKYGLQRYFDYKGIYPSNWGDVNTLADRLWDTETSPLSEAEYTQLNTMLEADITTETEYVIKYAMLADLYSFTNSYYYETISNDLNEIFGKSDFYSISDEFLNSFGENPEELVKFTNAVTKIYHDIYETDPTFEYNYNFMTYKPHSYYEVPSKIYGKNVAGTITEYTVAGLVDNGGTDSYAYTFTRNALKDYFAEEYSQETRIETSYEKPADEKYAYVIAKTDYNKGDVAIFTANHGSYYYDMTNSTYLEVSTFTNMLGQMKTIFLIIGAVTGALSAFLLLNFISVSISSKNKDIGILRAVGARGSDVFKIFFSESSIIALICFILASVAGGIVCYYINGSIREKLGIALLDYGVINVLLVLGVTLVISFIATIIPVSIASKKPPVEAIRSL